MANQDEELETFHAPLQLHRASGIRVVDHQGVQKSRQKTKMKQPMGGAISITTGPHNVHDLRYPAGREGPWGQRRQSTRRGSAPRIATWSFRSSDLTLKSAAEQSSRRGWTAHRHAWRTKEGPWAGLQEKTPRMKEDEDDEVYLDSFELWCYV